MVNYKEVMAYPLSDVKSFFTGFVLSVFWFLLFPLLFVWGYIVEVIRETLQHGNKSTYWFAPENWITLLKYGAVIFVISTIYLLPPLLIDMAAYSLSGNTIGASTGGIPSFNPLSMFLVIVGFILFLVLIFLLPMAIVLYSATEDIKYAFNPSEIFPRIQRAFLPYLKAYGVSILVFALFFLLLTVPLIGFLLGGILFYPLIFSARLFAEVFKEYEQ